MPKLPINLVKPPAFDNPLRRTTPASGSDATASSTNDEADQAPSGVVLTIAPNTYIDGTNSNPDIAPAPHRITVRIDDATRRALESDCYTRRVAGEKTNIAEIARNILRDWANRTD